ncbi:MAG: PhzF family phenazine biosynthesis protein [Selenomonadaceae bacterium]|nr:PhzF family phenazine biosynthesis protein [Selenomonadaceae bacterium]
MKQFIVDAFTDQVFAGNQAAICVLDEWLTDEMMLNIARENNFSETAFTVNEGDYYKLRWFTPTTEIDLCGHATLATAYVIMEHYDLNISSVIFKTLSGDLIVRKKGDLYEMDFPAYKFKHVEITDAMEKALGVRPIDAVLSRDLLMILDSENAVKNLKPDLKKLSKLDGLIQSVTAKGDNYDCVSRVFAPKIGITEDPVTGSTHCLIVPYWTEKLNKNKLTAFQASDRTGILYCENFGDRVKISGKAALYSISEILPRLK